VAKKAKRMSRKELRQPDEFEVMLQKSWERLEKYWKPIGYGLGAMVLVGAVASIASSSMESSQQETAAAFAAALAPLTAPLGEAPDPATGAQADSRERFPDRAAAVAAASGRLEVFLTDHGDADQAAAAGWLRAAVAGSDVATLQAWIDANPDTSLELSALLAIGDAHARAGDKAKAAEAYRTVAGRTNGFAKAMALMAVGDLDNPLAIDGGDAAAAKAAYEEAQQVIGPRPARNPLDVFASFSEPFLYAELENKLALLD
jgi:hypothetical protein